jgi:hypothetical protein
MRPHRSHNQQRVARTAQEDGLVHHDPQNIAEVFADFYENLYAELDGRNDVCWPCTTTIAEPVTIEEVTQALRTLRAGRTGSEDGLVAEMLKTGHHGLIEALARLFDDIFGGTHEVPDSWKKTKLKVIFKKGDVELPSNYMPISIIPVLGKLYSTILYNRIRELLDGQLADEQFGFRKGRGCSDAIHILRAVIEQNAEWGEELWIATLDVEKAFDRVHHSSLFEALVSGAIDAPTMAALRRLYVDLHASVGLWPGQESRHFAIQRGVRQGDPLSPLLFNLVLNGVWKK